jgi:hypothetical protein
MNANDILRDLYEPAAREELNNATALLEKLDPQAAKRKRSPYIVRKARLVRNRIREAFITLRHGSEHWEQW